MTTLFVGIVFYTMIVKLGEILGLTATVSPAQIGAIGAGANIAVAVGSIVFSRMKGASGPTLLLTGLTLAAIGYLGTGLSGSLVVTSIAVIVATLRLRHHATYSAHVDASASSRRRSRSRYRSVDRRILFRSVLCAAACRRSGESIWGSGKHTADVLGSVRDRCHRCGSEKKRRCKSFDELGIRLWLLERIGDQAGQIASNIDLNSIAT